MGGVISVVNPALDVPAVLAELRARITDELDYRHITYGQRAT